MHNHSLLSSIFLQTNSNIKKKQTQHNCHLRFSIYNFESKASFFKLHEFLHISNFMKKALKENAWTRPLRSDKLYELTYCKKIYMTLSTYLHCFFLAIPLQGNCHRNELEDITFPCSFLQRNMISKQNGHSKTWSSSYCIVDDTKAKIVYIVTACWDLPNNHWKKNNFILIQSMCLMKCKKKYFWSLWFFFSLISCYRLYWMSLFIFTNEI